MKTATAGSLAVVLAVLASRGAAAGPDRLRRDQLAPQAPNALRRYLDGPACLAGDAAACAELARLDRLFAGLAARTIYGTDPRYQPVASSSRACALGDWLSCAALASASQDCIEPLSSIGMELDLLFEPTASDGAANAVPLADAACARGDLTACKYVALAAYSGCHHAYDPAFAAPRLAKVLASLAPDCSAAHVAGCVAPGVLCGIVAARMADAAPPAAEGAPASVRRFSVSTTMPAWKGYTFDAKNLGDGDLTTSWQPNDKKFGGVAQWVTAELVAPTRVDGIAIANGLQKQDALGDLFALNNRVAQALVRFDDGTSEPITLAADARGLTTFRFPPHTTRSVRLVVKAIHRGAKWNDLAISELRVLGRTVTDSTRIEVPGACEVPRATLENACRAGDVAACDSWEVVALTSFGTSVGQAEFADMVFDAVAPYCTTTDTRRCDAAIHWAGLAGRDGEPFGERGCAAGSELACGAIGCHGEDAFLVLDAARKPPAAVCAAGCEHGDGAACLWAFGEAKDLGVVLRSDPRVKRAGGAAATCASARACADVASGLLPRDPGPMSFLDTFRSVMASTRACQLGDGASCDAALDFLGGDNGPSVPALKRALEKGKAHAEATVAPPPTDAAVAESSPHDAVSACLERGDCGAMCDLHVVREAFAKVSDDGTETFARATAAQFGDAATALELPGELIIQLCAEVRYLDRCSCGCC